MPKQNHDKSVKITKSQEWEAVEINSSEQTGLTLNLQVDERDGVIVFQTAGKEKAGPTEPLTTKEQAEYTACLDCIKRDRDGFMRMSRALYLIQSQRLYRQEYPSFKEFCLKVCGFGPKQGYRYVTAGKMNDQMGPTGDTPPITSDRQGRALAGVEPEKRAEVMKKAQERAGAGNVTGPLITRAHEEIASEAPTFEREPDDAVDVGEGEIPTPRFNAPPKPAVESLSLEDAIDLIDEAAQLAADTKLGRQQRVILKRLKAGLEKWEERKLEAQAA